MIANKLVNDTVPPLKVTDTGKKALSWMGEFFVQHLPVIDKQEFVGIISESDILDMDDPDKPLGEVENLKLLKVSVDESRHIFDVIKGMNEHQLSIMPVLNIEGQYEGLVTSTSLLDYFAKVSSMQEPGGIIILQIDVKDYSLAQIAQIIEGNNASILSMYVSTPSEALKMDVTIKINRSDLTDILATFERYKIQVKASYQESEYLDNLKERLDSFLHFLDI